VLSVLPLQNDAGQSVGLAHCTQTPVEQTGVAPVHCAFDVQPDVQTPDTHCCPAPQACPHAPQFTGSVCVLAVQVEEHCPCAHTGICSGPRGHTVPQAPQLLTSVCVLVQVAPHVVCPAAHAEHNPATHEPLWQTVSEEQADPTAARPQVPLVHGCPVGHAVPQPPQFAGSEIIVSQMPPHCVPGHESASPAACILYSTRRLASAPVFEGQVEPVRSDACKAAPAANVRTIGPLSDQYCPGASTRSWPLVPSVKRKTAAGQPVPVGVLAVAAMRKTVIG